MPFEKKFLVGRPTKLTDEVWQKIETAAANDCTLEEIALFAGINRLTLREWLQADPALAARVEELRANPMLKARGTIVNHLDDPNHARWYAERRAPKDFGQRIKQEVVTRPFSDDPATNADLDELAAEYEDKLKQKIVEARKRKEPNVVAPDNGEAANANANQSDVGGVLHHSDGKRGETENVTPGMGAMEIEMEHLAAPGEV